MVSERITVTLDDETSEMIKKIHGNVSKYVQECIRLRNKDSILTDPVIVYKELCNGNIEKDELHAYINRLEKQLQRCYES